MFSHEVNLYKGRDIYKRWKVERGCDGREGSGVRSREKTKEERREKKKDEKRRSKNESN